MDKLYTALAEIALLATLLWSTGTLRPFGL
jgi:hypothetical protein